MNCPARNDKPASAIVSDICSSISAPWVEMSGAIHHVCRRIGIAEAIAIAKIVTAKNFAMVSRFGSKVSSWPIGVGCRTLRDSPSSCGVGSYLALKAKSAFAGAPAVTVTF